MTASESASEPAKEQEVPTPDNQVSEAPPELAIANAKIAELEKKLAEMKDQALRALAEADNIRKRAERAKEDTAKFAVSSFARDLLSVADNLRRALAAMPAEAREKNPELVNIHTGVAAVERDLLRIFENNGIKRIDPINEKFDANMHEVMFEVEVPNQAPGTIVQVIDPGFLIHERLLRPARVGVAKGEIPPAGETIDKQV